MQDTIKSRIDNFRNLMADQPFDTFMVIIQENRSYLSGFTGEDGGFNESAGCLFIKKDKLLLATDSRYETAAKEEAPLFEIYCYKKEFSKALPEILKELNTKKLGFESTRLSIAGYEKIKQELKSASHLVELLPVKEQLVEKLRIIKEPGEIEKIRQAVEIAESAFESVSSKIIPGMTEKQVAWEMEKQMRILGADRLAFPTIVASGPEGAKPHAVPTDRKFEKNEIILFDWGVRLNGYCSDTSRTIFLGKTDEKFKRAYQALMETQKRVTQAIRPGKSTKAITKIAHQYLVDMEFEKEKFTHGLGHGVGIAVHENPSLSLLEERNIILKENMVVTVEPGIYLPGEWGIRLENMVVVKKDGAEVLNRLPF
ncbi:Xaa-Pro dipeptidase [Candidatus Magnetomoraceae bacterium gMMP-15]